VKRQRFAQYNLFSVSLPTLKSMFQSKDNFEQMLPWISASIAKHMLMLNGNHFATERVALGPKILHTRGITFPQQHSAPRSLTRVQPCSKESVRASPALPAQVGMPVAFQRIVCDARVVLLLPII